MVVEEGWEVVDDAFKERQKLDPVNVMKKAVSKESYDGLVLAE